MICSQSSLGDAKRSGKPETRAITPSWSEKRAASFRTNFPTQFFEQQDFVKKSTRQNPAS